MFSFRLNHRTTTLDLTICSLSPHRRRRVNIRSTTLKWCLLCSQLKTRMTIDSGVYVWTALIGVFFFFSNIAHKDEMESIEKRKWTPLAVNQVNTGTSQPRAQTTCFDAICISPIPLGRWKKLKIRLQSKGKSPAAIHKSTFDYLNIPPCFPLNGQSYF